MTQSSRASTNTLITAMIGSNTALWIQRAKLPSSEYCGCREIPPSTGMPTPSVGFIRAIAGAAAAASAAGEAAAAGAAAPGATTAAADGAAAGAAANAGGGTTASTSARQSALIAKLAARAF